MTYYHWLGIDAEPIADETDTPDHWIITEHDDGRISGENIEADGFITLHPKIQTPPTR